MTFAKSPKRHLPFLQRNWNQGVGNVWQPMGAKVSAQRRTILGDGGENRIHVSSDRRDGRPAKRPRIYKDPSPDDPSAVLAGIPSIDEFLLPKDPPDTPPTLRIDVLKIVHKDSERRVKPRVSLTSLDEPAQPLTDEVTIRARCKITIYDNSPPCQNPHTVVLCTAQGCDIKTFKNPVGSSRMARIYLDQPFVIPQDDIKVVREDGTFNLAESYRLDVEIYGMDSTQWPPLDIEVPRSKSGSSTSRWVLICCVLDLFRRQRSSVDMFVHQYTRECLSPTSFIMDIDSRWSTGIQGTAATCRPEKGVLPSITVGAEPSGEMLTNGHVNGDVGHVTNGHSEHLVNGDSGSLHNGSVRAFSEDLDGETTPNRSLRNRGNRAVYNLKLLSDKAQGKDRRRRKPMAAPPLTSDGNVVYLIPSEEVSLDSYRCIACAAPHQSLQLLQVHLRTQHVDYSYELLAARGTPQFKVAHQYERYSFSHEEFQFTKPTKAFNLERMANGSVSGLNDAPQPRTALEKALPVKPAVPKRPKLPPKKVLVPHTKLPMYDPVTRARLEPGSELVPPRFDNAWWLQKHRDMITDFSDIDLQEREYLIEWDSFCLPRRISGDTFFPPLWLDFVREKAAWIVATAGRQEEFLKHLAYLQARDALDQKTMDAAVMLLDEARTQKKDQTQNGGQEGESPASPKEQGSRKYQSCDVCKVAGVRVVCILKCSNVECSRVFHLNCIQETMKMSPTTEAWLCNNCASK